MTFKPRQFKKTTKPVTETSIVEEPKVSIDKDSLIFGKDKTTNIVSIEVEDEKLVIFREVDGVVSSEERENLFWIVNPSKSDQSFQKLEGDLHYNWIKTMKNRKVYEASRRRYSFSWSVWNPVESAMIYQGLSYFKGMKVEDVSVLSFDIESAGLMTMKHKEVYMISNTYKSQGKVTKKLFSSDEFKSEGEMITAWCDWVMEVDPSVMVGHNILGYDFPYLVACAKKCKVKLNLGRDGSQMKTKKGRNPDKFRVDGSQAWEYRGVSIYGREVIDTMFLCVRWDFSRKLPSWGLKPIIESLGFVKEDRVFYDASKIRDNWDDPVERAKIKAYGIDDSDDSLALYELMIPANFYFAQKVPKPFCDLINKATGSQMNSIMVRGYLQNNHSLPKASDKVPFEGAISMGIPGVYKNMIKLDLSNFYPAIMRQYNIYSKEKDPLKFFPYMVEYFAMARLKNKKLYKETGDRYYDDLQQAEKIGSNSLFGFCGAPGLLFNYPEGAAEITRRGREILSESIEYVTSKDVDYWRDIFKEKTK